MTHKEGYLLIDNRASGQGMLEAATLTCSHCQLQMVRNPARERARGYCPKCDHYVCDACETARVKTGVCRTFNEIIDIVQEQAIRGELISNPQSLVARTG